MSQLSKKRTMKRKRQLKKLCRNDCIVTRGVTHMNGVRCEVSYLKYCTVMAIGQGFPTGCPLKRKDFYKEHPPMHCSQ